MNISKRGFVLGTLLLVSIVAAVKVNQDEMDSIVQVADRSVGSLDRRSDMQTRISRQENEWGDQNNDLDRLQYRKIDSDLSFLFFAAYKPQKTETAVIPPQPVEPTAPPLPFRFLGKMHENDQITLFVSQDENNLVVKTGDIVDGIYRLDSIRENSAEFTYLPLQLKQTLQIGGGV